MIKLNTKEFIEYMLSNGIDDIQITAKTTYEQNIKIINNQTDNNQIDQTTKYIIKATANNKTTSLTTETLDKDIINLIKEKLDYLDSPKETFISETINNNTEEMPKPQSLNLITDKILGFHKEKSKYQKVTTITSEISYRVSHIKIENKNGLHMESSNEAINLYIEIIATDEDKNISRMYKETKKDIKEFNLKELYHTLYSDSEKQLVKEPLETGKYKVILVNRAVTKIIDYIIDMVNSENIYKDLSIFKDKLNTKVFSSNFTLLEEPLNRKLPSYRYFDDEGIITQNKEIIKNGILKTYLYNNKQALINKKTSTGNGYNNRISVSNYYLNPGKKSFDELIKDLDNGIVIEQLSGNVDGIKPNIGSFSYQASGYLVEKGKKKTYLESFIFSSSIQDLFNDILEIGNDLHFVNSVVGSPSILIKETNLVGDK